MMKGGGGRPQMQMQQQQPMMGRQGPSHGGHGGHGAHGGFGGGKGGGQSAYGLSGGYMAPQQPVGFAPPPAGIPAFMGAASRKRKHEIAAEMGLIPKLGHSHMPQQRGGGMGMRRTPPSAAPQLGGRAAPGGGAAAARAAPAAAMAGAKEAVKWLNLPPGSQFAAMGMPELGPCVFQEEVIKDMLANSAHILNEFTIDLEQVVFQHDSDWDTYPEVAEAIKSQAGQELPLCVAICEEKAIWAVGAATGWKKREQTAKLALCVALAANLDDFEKLAKSQPEFTQLCEAVGIQTGASFAAPAAKKARGAMKKPQAQPYDPEEQPVVSRAPAKGGKAGGGKAAGGKGKAPKDNDGRDVPVWLNLEGQDLGAPLDSLMTEVIALANNGTGRRNLYFSADAALAHFIGEDLIDQVQYIEDPDWENFPVVGAAIKEAMGKEECMTIAVLEPACCWAVGVGMKGKNRQVAAKVALAATMAIQTADVGEAMGFEDFPDLQEFVEEARKVRGD